MAPEGSRTRLIAKFRALSIERLERMSNDFVQLEQTPRDVDLAKRLVREIHSLKGEARLMGFAQVNEVAHRTEELIHAARDREFKVSPRVRSAVLEGLDRIEGLVQGRELATSFDTFDALVSECLTGIDAGAHEDSEPGGGTLEPELELHAATTQGGEGPPVDDVPEYLRIGLDRLDEITSIAGDLVLQQARSDASLDLLRSLVAEWEATLTRSRYVLARSEGAGLLPDRVEVLGASFAALVEQGLALAKSATAALDRAREQSFEYGLRVDDLDHAVRDLRFLPISTLLGRFPRPVRDLASALGKRVQLEVRGADVAMDKQVLDRLWDPLLHLVRNAVDHGIESPEDRRSHGKPPTGRIVLEAMQVGSTVELRISDDGAGLDHGRVLDRAVRLGLINAEEAASLPDDRVGDLIFEPGLSTCEGVTDVSGRGVGLEVVRSEVEALGGTVHVRWTTGVRTEFRLRVPTSTVLSRTLLVKVGTASFALPASSVRDALVLAPAEIEVTGRSTTFVWGGARTELADLGIVLGISEAREPTGAVAIVVVEHDSAHLGLRVTRFAGEHQVVQRPLDPFIERLDLVQASVALPRGEVALLLDIPTLMREATFRARWRPATATAPDGGVRQPIVLVVDDSEFTRDMVVGLLRETGFMVLEAVDGRQGLERALERRPDVILTDLDMPVLDGFGLLRELRSRGDSTPVIVFSTHGEPSDKRRAAELGADAYLVKAEFHEDRMLATLRRFLPSHTGRT